MRFMQMFTGITVSFVLVACAAVQGYEGPALPDDETALIATSTRGDRDGWDYRSYFTAIDVDTPLENVANVRVLPGRRCVTLRLIREGARGASPRGRTGSTGSSLCFEAIAGRTYETRVDRSRRPIPTWLVDLETGETVAEGTFGPVPVRP